MYTPAPSMKEQVEEYVKYWQKQLRLMDWVMTVEIYEDLEKCGGYGHAEHSKNFQTVKYGILNPDKIPSDWVGTRDLEVTVVHEILHTRLTFLSVFKKENHHMEMGIETIAKALVANRRGITPEELV